MTPQRVLFIDTSVLCNLVDVPGRNQHRDRVRAEFAQLIDGGVRFILPVTAVIETGNHIANAAGDRRAAAERLAALLREAARSTAPWQLHAVTWDAGFLGALLNGDGTGQPLVDLLGNGQMGTGDVAILCERDLFRERTRFDDVGIWTLESTLGAYS
jgi:hypothetical protein